MNMTQHRCYKLVKLLGCINRLQVFANPKAKMCHRIASETYSRDFPDIYIYKTCLSDFPTYVFGQCPLLVFCGYKSSCDLFHCKSVLFWSKRCVLNKQCWWPDVGTRRLVYFYWIYTETGVRQQHALFAYTICVASLQACWWVLSRNGCPMFGWKLTKCFVWLGAALAVLHCRRALGEDTSQLLLADIYPFASVTPQISNLNFCFRVSFPVHGSFTKFSLKLNEPWNIKMPKIRGTCSLQLNTINMSEVSSQDVQWHYRKSPNNISDSGGWRKIIGLAEHTHRRGDHSVP